ncbi:MAG TPA: 50S ribosomal protein L13 [Nitrososphaerales archaeon]|nr:50S ribosomal protein L13 [Nitrososphaerales archaeon]HUK74233.1 50S ribosomal protein L13 [Nitrososphaerales archaeon]
MSSKPKAAAPEAAPSEPEKAPTDGVLYVDATGAIAGRLSSKVAHEVIRGKRIVVLNAEKAVLTGDRNSVIAQWKQRLELGSKVNPIYGPIHPRRPDNILRRMVRGMVPKEKTKGVEGLKRLRVYMGVPSKYSGVTMSRFDEAMATRPLPTYTTLQDLSRNIGWNG